MATAAYTLWNRAGRPLEPALPVREIVTRLKAQYPRAAHLFGWHADDAHYQANPPLDHTPYSTDEWPVAVGPYVVFATDVAHRPDLGVDCRILAPYWLAEARAGRFKALKYLIWQGANYDVRNGYRRASADGHFDHAHLSIRTDYRFTSLGTWPIIPTGGKTMIYLHNPKTGGVAIGDGITWRSIPNGSVLAQLQAAMPGQTIDVNSAEDQALYGVDVTTLVDHAASGGVDVQAVAEAVADELHERTAE